MAKVILVKKSPSVPKNGYVMRVSYESSCILHDLSIKTGLFCEDILNEIIIQASKNISIIEIEQEEKS